MSNENLHLMEVKGTIERGFKELAEASKSRDGRLSQIESSVNQMKSDIERLINQIEGGTRPLNERIALLEQIATYLQARQVDSDTLAQVQVHQSNQQMEIEKIQKTASTAIWSAFTGLGSAVVALLLWIFNQIVKNGITPHP